MDDILPDKRARFRNDMTLTRIRFVDMINDELHAYKLQPTQYLPVFTEVILVLGTTAEQSVE
jgi:hypothetical protein